MPDKNIARLIARRLNNEISPVESLMLELWLSESKLNQQYFDSLRRIWIARAPVPSFDSGSAFARIQPKLFFLNHG